MNPPFLTTRRFRLALVACFVAAFGLRVGLTHVTQGLASPPSHDLGLDQLDYELFAYHMSIGEGYSLAPGEPTARRTPGTSLSLLPVYLLFGRNFLAARLWWCFLSAATVVFTGLVASRLWGYLAGAIAAAATALYPGHFYYATHFESEVPFALYLMIGALCLITATDCRWWLAAPLSGIFWGLAILTRAQLLLAIPVAALLIIGSRHGRSHATFYSSVLASVALVVAPWVLRNFVVFGKPTIALMLSAYTFWGAHNDLVLSDPALQGKWIALGRLADPQHPLTGSEVEREAAAWRYSFQWLEAHRTDMPWLTLMKVWRLITPFEETRNRYIYWVFAAAWLIAAPLFAGGWFLAARTRPVETWILSLPLLATFLATVGFYGCIRFRDSVAPVFLTFAAILLAHGWAWLTQKSSSAVPRASAAESAVGAA